MTPYLRCGSVWYWGLQALDALSTPVSKGGCLADSRPKHSKPVGRTELLPSHRRWDFNGTKSTIFKIIEVACETESGSLMLPRRLEKLPLSMRPAGCAPYADPPPAADSETQSDEEGGSAGQKKDTRKLRTDKGTKRPADAAGVPPRDRGTKKSRRAAAAEKAARQKRLQEATKPVKAVDIAGNTVTVAPEVTPVEDDESRRRVVRFRVDAAVPFDPACTPQRESALCNYIATSIYTHDLVMSGEDAVDPAVRRGEVLAMLARFRLDDGDVNARVDRILQLYEVRFPPHLLTTYTKRPQLHARCNEVM